MIGRLKKTSGLLILVLVLAIIMVVPVQATVYTATSENLNVLYQGSWYTYQSSPLKELIGKPSTDNLYTNGLSKTQVNVNSKVSSVGVIPALKVGNGQCAVFVEAIAPKIVQTASWKKGTAVFTKNPTTGKITFNNIPAGTVVATFSGNTYYGHCAIFGDAPTTGGMNVWDANYIYSGVVGRHNIPCSGSGVSNALNYYVVNY